MVKVLDDAFGVHDRLMTTIHAYTNDRTCSTSAQGPAPGPRGRDQHRALPRPARRARTSLVLASMKGRLDGSRCGSRCGRPQSPTSRRSSRRRASTRSTRPFAPPPKSLKGVARLHRRLHRLFGHRGTRRRAPSTPDDHSCSRSTTRRACEDLRWYDNEWGYSNRLVDSASTSGSSGGRAPVLRSLGQPQGQTGFWFASTSIPGRRSRRATRVTDDFRNPLKRCRSSKSLLRAARPSSPARTSGARRVRW